MVQKERDPGQHHALTQGYQNLDNNTVAYAALLGHERLVHNSKLQNYT